MAYEFTGIFASPAMDRPTDLPDWATWKQINDPFVGVGVKVPDRDGTPTEKSEDEVLDLLRQLGLSNAQRWIYLHYVCWGGTIDFVFGLGSRDGTSFGPVEEDSLSKVDRVFTDLMNQFGVSLSEGGYFEPFVRGYWD